MIRKFEKEKRKEISDDELVSQVKKGDSTSFVQLVDRYKKGLYRMFYRNLRNHADAEDLTQEVFLKAYANLSGFREESSFKTWLYKIAINLSTNFMKSGRFKREILDDTFMQKEDGGPSGIIENLIKKDSSRLLRDAMETLPDKQKMTLTLRIDKELKNREIAEILDCPVGTVKANLFHAINHIRKTLKDNGYEFQ